MGNVAEALKDYNMTIQLNNGNAGAYFNRSMANKSLGNFKDALNDALKAQSLGYNVNVNYINDLKAKAK